MQITTIGLDIAKNVFQVHGIDAAEKVVVRKQLRRSQVLAFFKALPPCLIGMEACATAHYWARELTKLGHEDRLMPAKDVKAYVKRNNNDAADAEAICEAVRRPTMRFVRAKSAEQQGRLMLHRARDLLMRQRTQVINALRAHLAELGITAAQGTAGLKEPRPTRSSNNCAVAAVREAGYGRFCCRSRHSDGPRRLLRFFEAARCHPLD
jgi:transposase